MAMNLNLNVAEIPKLGLESVIGIGGCVPGGMFIHPNGENLVYTLGSCLVVREIGNPRADDFLLGHTGPVSCVTVSRSGQYVASGQSTHMGFQADICVFEYATKRLVFRLTLHKVKVQALAFSADECYLASLGGQDDNTLVVWDLSTGRPLCGGPASTDLSMCISFFNQRSDKLVTGGQGLLRVWDVDTVNRKIKPTDVNLAMLKRTCRNIVIEPSDKYAYIGTTTGDLLCVQLTAPYSIKFSGPKKPLVQGVLCMALTDSGDILVGSGGGEVALLNPKDLKMTKSVNLIGGATSVSAHGDHYFVSTSRSNVYYLNARTFKEELRQTCHYERINDVAFPHNYSELFATCSNHDVRVWNARTSAEMLRISVQNLECNCISFTVDGKCIVTGWSDGKIRAFAPQSGTLLYVIPDAHKTVGMKRVSGHLVGVTAIGVDHQSDKDKFPKIMISGGADCQVRVWSLGRNAQKMLASMKEHKATVNAVCLRADDTECVSASDDGSCILWDLKAFRRRGILRAPAYFKSLAFFPDESQLLTVQLDNKITYWDTYECNEVRELEGSKSGGIFSLDITADGQRFVTGGGDKIVKMWDYDTGAVVQVGLGHSGSIQRVRFSPDGDTVVSVGDEAGIFIWNVDKEHLAAD